MKVHTYKLAVISILSLALSGCSSTGVVPLDSGVYYISKGEPTLGGGPPSASLISSVYGEARQFCAKQGLIPKIIEKRYEDGGAAKLATFSLELRCVKK